ncbi:hypothetical protein ACFQ1R_11690, partial [Mariniflexile jejuense]
RYPTFENQLNMFKRLFNKKFDWQKVKASGEAFPKPKISVVSTTLENGTVATAWINVGYRNYPYKEFCQTLGILNVDFEDMGGLDYSEIQTYLDTELNKACVSHLISRIPTETGIEMLFYFENQDIIQNKLEELYKSDDLLFDFGCRLKTDSEWETIDNMMKNY